MGVLEGDRPGRGGARPGAGRPLAQPQVNYQPTRDDSAKSASLLSPTEIEAIRDRAREQVAQELKDRATKQLLDEFVEAERRLSDPSEELLEIFLDLAPHSQYIMLDGRQFLHHHAYKVKRSVFSVLVEQINRGWAHDDQTQVVDAKGRRRWRPPMGIGFDNFGARVGRWGANANLTVSAGEAMSQPSPSIMGIKGAVEGLQG